jgi:hypothetical protein
MGTRRFLCASWELSLSGLLRRRRQALFGALGLAVLAHLSFSQITGLRQEERTAKPLTTQFVKRQPRLTKPLEMKKRPRPKRRQVQRKMVAVKARSTSQHVSSSIRPGLVVRSLSGPDIQVGRVLQAATVDMEPQALAQRITSAREDKHVVDMSLEMVDIDALDTGQYQAMVIQDPTDKRNIRGYFHIAQALIPSIAKANASTQWGVFYNSPLVFPHALQRLAEQVTRYTGIQCDVSETFEVSSANILKTPWVLIPAKASFKLTDSEADVLGTYLTRGGFIFAGDTLHNIKSWTSASFREMFEKALLTRDKKLGHQWAFEKLAQEHPLYHCFFDFDSLPVGFDDWNGPEGQRQYGVPYAVQYMDGIVLDGRLIGLMDYKGYFDCWAWFNPIDGFRRFGVNSQAVWDGTRQYQLGVNIIVYVLTQEGSITRRVMDTVR